MTCIFHVIIIYDYLQEYNNSNLARINYITSNNSIQPSAKIELEQRHKIKVLLDTQKKYITYKFTNIKIKNA